MLALFGIYMSVNTEPNSHDVRSTENRDEELRNSIIETRVAISKLDIHVLCNTSTLKLLVLLRSNSGGEQTFVKLGQLLI